MPPSLSVRCTDQCIIDADQRVLIRLWYHLRVSELQLNPAQCKAVQHTTGSLLIIAGAGTGKTRVITRRISWLVTKELAKTSEILALTFTQKAAQEMEERVDVEMPYGYEPAAISTFHSFCDTVLKQEAIYIGLDPSYILMSQAQEYVFFREKLHEFSLDIFRPQGNPAKFIGELLKYFSRLADEDIDPNAYAVFVAGSKVLSKEERKEHKELSGLYKEYSEAKKREAHLGFSDLVPLVLTLFRTRPKVLQRYQEKFPYILVDEFQDTNFAQNELLKLLAGKKANITVVGDDDQSIYKFRGAAISNILDFKTSFPSYTKVVLTKNYRSTQQILDCAYSLIEKNNPYRLEVTENIDKRLISDRSLHEGTARKKATKRNFAPKDQTTFISGKQVSAGATEGQRVRRIHEINDVAEAEAVATEILRLVNKGKSYRYDDIAILVRAHDHADECIRSLRYHGIPFRFLGPKGLYTRPEVKDMIAVLSVLRDYADDAFLYRVLSMTGGHIQPREYIDLQRTARKRHISLFELLEELFDRDIGVRITSSSKSGKKAKKQNLAPVVVDTAIRDRILSAETQMWIQVILDAFDEGFQAVKASRTVGSILFDFVEKIGFLKELLAEQSQEREWKAQNIGAYFESLKRFEKDNENAGIAQYMDYLVYSLEIGENPQVDQSQMADFNGVQISTVHGAKGLEFPVVFMMNLVNERFPTRRRSDVIPVPDALVKEVLPEGDEHLQEERRLCYVGITRAKDLLYFTSADYYAQGVRKKKQSVFLQDMDCIAELTKVSQRPSERDFSRGAYSDDADISIPDDVRANFVQSISHNLSYSHISSFETCPYQFYFKYVLEIPGLQSASRSFGMTVHNTLRAFYERLMRSKQGFDTIEKAPNLEDLLEMYDQKWQSGGYESKAQENRRYTSGKKALSHYYETFYSQEENPIWLEGRFKVDVGTVRMSGVVDRLDEYDGGYEIIDYKTGNIPKDPRAFEKNLQLPIYVLAVESLKELPVHKVSLLYVESGKKLTAEVTDKMKDASVAEICKTFDTINAMTFPPKPGMLCKFCDYRTICDYAAIG